MGLYIGRSFSTYDGYLPKSLVDPIPTDFSFEEIHEINNHLIAIITYPNCTNFEGKKILVFKSMYKEELLKQTSIDPHFSKNGLSPFARFVPTKEGLEAAIKLCQNLD